MIGRVAQESHAKDSGDKPDAVAELKICGVETHGIHFRISPGSDSYIIEACNSLMVENSVN